MLWPILGVMRPLFSRPAAFGLALLVAMPASLAAQATAGCPADTLASGRVCQAASDALTIFLPIEGLLVGGGNPLPGSAGGIGQLGHVRLVGRVGFTKVTIPDVGYDGTSDTVAAEKRLTVPVPRLDAAFGLFSKTLPLGTATVDFVASAVLIPTGSTTRIAIDKNARQVGGLALGLGFGMRAALAMAKNKPTVSLNVMKRDIPRLRFGNRAAGDPMQLSTTLSAINARLMVGGKKGPVTLAAGAGMDLFKGDGLVTFADSTTATGDSTVAVPLSTSRIMTALNLGLTAGPLSFWAEGGLQVGKKTELATPFELNDPSGSRFYGGVGFALQF